MKYKKIIIVLSIILLIEILAIGCKYFIDYLEQIQLPEKLQVKSNTTANANCIISGFTFFKDSYVVGSIDEDEYIQTKRYAREELKVEKNKGIEVLLFNSSPLFIHGKDRSLKYSIYDKKGTEIKNKKIEDIGLTVKIDVKDLEEDIYYMSIFYHASKGSGLYAIKLKIE